MSSYITDDGVCCEVGYVVHNGVMGLWYRVPGGVIFISKDELYEIRSRCPKGVEFVDYLSYELERPIYGVSTLWNQ